MIKKSIGIVLKYDKEWIGGIYYKIHIIRALFLVKKDFKIIVYTNLSTIQNVKELMNDIPVTILPFDPILKRGVYSIENFFRKKLNFSLIGYFDSKLSSVNSIFDFDDIGILRAVKKNKRFYWIPDLQDLYLPELFTKEQIEFRKLRYQSLAKNAKNLIFSSEDSKISFTKFFLKNDYKPHMHVCRFTVFHPIIQKEDINELKLKYGIINTPYFIVSNQFMAHKNHIVVIEALHLLKVKNNLNFKVIFTGQTNDPRNPDFFKLLVDKIKLYGLNDSIIITGLIDRNEQLCLMTNSMAVIQPSLFEGWNSTIEDAKLLACNLICSDIAINREQMEGYAVKFFNKNDYVSLSDILFNYPNTKSEISNKYTDKQIEFGKQMLQILS